MSSVTDMKQFLHIVDEGSNDQEVNHQQIAAIGQLIADRTEDENSPSKLSTDAFVNIINKMGIPMTKDMLKDLKQNGEIGNVIKDVNNDEVFFKGQHEIDSDKMSVDKAKDIVGKMAKRSAKKGIHKENFRRD